MRMIEIDESKKGMLSDYTEKILRYAGKIMQCVEDIEGGEGYGERSGTYRHFGMRDHDDYDPEYYGERYSGDGYGERRGVRGTGPYSRYR